MSLRILICDDHKIMLDGLKSILKTEKEIDSIFTCQSANEALQLMQTEQIDIALLDINMPDINGIELTKKIRLLFPSTKIIILTMNNNLGSIQQTLEAGAQGFILKNTDKRELMEGIRKVNLKGKYFSREVADILITGIYDDNKKNHKETEPKTFELTPREIEIIKLKNELSKTLLFKLIACKRIPSFNTNFLLVNL